MKDKIIVFIDDDYKRTTGDFIKYSKIIEKAETGCKILAREKIQDLLSTLSNNQSTQEEKLNKWLNNVFTDYEIMAFVLDIELNTNPLDGITILNKIRNCDFFDAISKNQFFCNYVPIIMFTGVDDKKDKYENSSYKEKIPTHFLSKNTISDDGFKNILKKEIEKYFNLSKSIQIKTLLTDFKTTLDSTKEDTTNIKKKLNEIENMNKTMLKSLPQIVTAEQRKNLQKFIKTDMLSYMDKDLEEFFLKEEDKKKFLKVVSSEFDKILEKDLKKGAWDAFTDSIKTIAQSQGIPDDNAALCAFKLSYRGYSEISSFLKGNAEI